MTKEEVIKQARAICKKIEVDLKSKPQSVDFSDKVGVLGTIPWEPRWELRFSEANVAISDQNGDLTHFVSHVPYTDISKLSPEDSEIPESGLAQKAIYFAKILKIPDISYSKYSIVRGGIINGVHEPKAIFFWKRRFQNVEYLNQHFSLTLDSYSGRVIGFGRIYLTGFAS